MVDFVVDYVFAVVVVVDYFVDYVVVVDYFVDYVVDLVDVPDTIYHLSYSIFASFAFVVAVEFVVVVEFGFCCSKYGLATNLKM